MPGMKIIEGAVIFWLGRWGAALPGTPTKDHDYTVLFVFGGPKFKDDLTMQVGNILRGCFQNITYTEGDSRRCITLHYDQSQVTRVIIGVEWQGLIGFSGVIYGQFS
jgi:hypothetical protein